MSTAYYQFQSTPVMPAMNMSHNSANHHARHRRAPKLSVAQNNQHKQFRGVRSVKELAETSTPALSSFRDKFEAVRSFDLEDDLEFIPGMLTETDLVSISSASEQSSVASLSPGPSPLQHTVAPTFTLNSASAAFFSQASLRLQQPAASRVRNAIPIINPLDGSTIPSPPPFRNVSPGRILHQQQQHSMQQAMTRRW